MSQTKSRRLARHAVLAVFAFFELVSLRADQFITSDTTWDLTVNPRVLTETVRIQNNAKLTILPGVIVKPQTPSVSLIVDSGAIDANQAVFTSYKDDSRGGDTNGDGSASSPAVGDWGTIRLTGSGSKFNYCVFKYGGVPGDGVLVVRGPAEIKSCLFEMNRNGIAIRSAPQSLLIEGCTIQNNVSAGIVDGSGNLDGTVIRGNNIHDNDNALFFASPGSVVLEGNRLHGISRLIEVWNADVQLLGLDTNVISAPGAKDGINYRINMIMTKNITWNSKKFTFIIDGTNIGSLIINAGATLTIAPGTIIKFPITVPGSGILVNGRLIAEGTETDPIHFTSVRDDTVGGDSNRSEGSISPNARDWGPIVLAGDGSKISYCTFRYGGNLGFGWPLEIGGTSEVTSSLFENNITGIGLRGSNLAPLIKGCTVQNNLVYGIHAFNANNLNGTMIYGNSIHHNIDTGMVFQQFGGTPTVSNNRIELNGQNAMRIIGSGLVDARYNYWGDSSGPRDTSDDRATGGWYNPNGLGGVVTNLINYNPWLGNTVLSNPKITVVEGSTVTSRFIHLQLSVDGPATQIRISEKSNFPVNFEPYANNKDWTLTTGDGVKNIFAQFTSADGSVSDVVSVVFNLQESLPSVAIRISKIPPISLGSINITLTASEFLQAIPTLTLQPSGQNAIPISLTTNDFQIFSGSYTVTQQSGNGVATFSFSGVDLGGSIGTTITSGSTFFIDTLPPAPPVLSQLYAESTGVISYFWSSPPGEISPSFNVYRATESITENTNNTLVLNGFRGNAAGERPPVDGLFYYAVKAIDQAGNISSFSNVMSAVADRLPPLPVTSLSAKLTTPVDVHISWSAPEGEAPARYRLYRALSSTPIVSSVHLIKETTGFFHNDRITNSGLYYYGVTTLDALTNQSAIVVTSTVTIIDTQPPFASSVNYFPPDSSNAGLWTIEGIYSEPMDTRISPTVTLKPLGSSVTFHVVQKSFENTSWTGSILISTEMPEGIATLSFSGGRDILLNTSLDKTFQFLIDFTPPLPPIDFTASSSNNGTEVQLQWTASEPNGTFSIYRSTLSDFSSTVKIVTGLFNRHFIDTPPAGSALAYYAVTQTDGARLESALSVSTSIALPLTPLISVPEEGARLPSTQLTIEGHAHANITVRIISSTGGVIGEGTANSASEFAIPVVLTGQGEYFIRAQAQDSSGRLSVLSPVRHFFVGFAPSTPASPTTETGDTTISLTWPANSEEDITGYWVYRDGSTTPLNSVLVPAEANPHFQDIGLTNGRSYIYRVAAQNQSSEIGPKSDPVSASPISGEGW